MLSYKFAAKLWLYGGEGSWYFITVPQKFTQDIKAVAGMTQRRGFGAVKVTAVSADARWETSIFPDSKSDSYLLPVKKDVRQKLGAGDGDELKIELIINGV